MEKGWSDDAWDDYVDWQSEDRKTIKRINQLLKDIETNGVGVGIGKPERLKHIDAWSRRIDDANRLVYNVEKNELKIFSCKGHYEDI
jgi:toxin YoeB